jgi:hypothetical protein
VRPRQRGSASPPSPLLTNTCARPSSDSSPRSDLDALAIAFWALVHGLAFLHLDGKLDGGSTAAMKDRVGAAIHAVLAAEPQG